jgi:hypothetical protein
MPNFFICWFWVYFSVGLPCIEFEEQKLCGNIIIEKAMILAFKKMLVKV